MSRVQQMMVAMVGSVLAILLAIGGMTAFAQTPTPDTATPDATTTTPVAPPARGDHGIGFGGRGWGGNSDQKQYLADALGITVAELESAYTEAQNAILDDAVTAGTITQEQADLIKAREIVETYFDKTATYDTAEARQAAYTAAVQAAVDDGAITQAQADQLLAEGTRSIGGRGGPGGRGGRGAPPAAPSDGTTDNSGTSGTSVVPSEGI